MGTVKLCTYSRAFYPCVYGSKIKLVMAAFVIIQDGKIIKRSFRECHDYMVEDHAENEAFAKGLEWVVGNVDDLRDTNLQVIFCGAARTNNIKRINENRYFRDDLVAGAPVEDPCTFMGNDKLLKLFNKVTYHQSASITVNDGDDDEGGSTRFKVYDAVNTYFGLLYGDDVNFGHKVFEHVPDETLVSGIRVILVGQPELHLNSVWGKPTPWT